MLEPGLLSAVSVDLVSHGVVVMAAGRSVLGRGQVAQGRLPVACVVLVREVADHHWGSSRVVQWLRRGTAATSNRSTIGYGTNASTSRIAIDSDGDLAVRQLVRRASASGEFVAVYDPRRRWAVATASSRIWNTTDWRTQPPRPPTVVVVVHNGAANPYPGALVSISVRAPGPRSVEPNVCITQRSRRIRIETEWFTARRVAATLRYEQTVLN